MQTHATIAEKNPAAPFKQKLFDLERYYLLSKLQAQLSSKREFSANAELVLETTLRTIEREVSDTVAHRDNAAAIIGMLEALQLLCQIFEAEGIKEYGLFCHRLVQLYSRSGVRWLQPALAKPRAWLLGEVAREWVATPANSARDSYGELLVNAAVADDGTPQENVVFDALKRATGSSCDPQTLTLRLAWVRKEGADMLAGRSPRLLRGFLVTLCNALSRNEADHVSEALLVLGPLHGNIAFARDLLQRHVKSIAPLAQLSADLQHRLVSKGCPSCVVEVLSAGPFSGRIGVINRVRLARCLLAATGGEGAEALAKEETVRLALNLVRVIVQAWLDESPLLNGEGAILQKKHFDVLVTGIVDVDGFDPLEETALFNEL